MFLASSTTRRARRAIALFDATAERAFDRVRGGTLDHVAFPLSSAADHSMLWHVAGAVRAMRTRDPMFAARFSAAMGIESFATNVVIKSAFERVRPHRPLDAPMLYGLRRPITSSFPSGHATAAFCAATLLAKGSRAAPAWYVLAAGVAATRVHVRLHYASDVVAGAALGLALGYALRPLVPAATAGRSTPSDIGRATPAGTDRSAAPGTDRSATTGLAAPATDGPTTTGTAAPPVPFPAQEERR